MKILFVGDEPARHARRHTLITAALATTPVPTRAVTCVAWPEVVRPRCIRAALETLGPVHEPNSVINSRAKSGRSHDLRYTRIESTSADYSARLADDIDTEGVRVTQQAGIPGEVRNLDQDVPWMLTVTFRIGRRPT